MFETFQHRAQALEGRVVVKQGLCKRFFGEAQAGAPPPECREASSSLRQGAGLSTKVNSASA